MPAIAEPKLGSPGLPDRHEHGDRVGFVEIKVFAVVLPTVTVYPA